MKTLKLLSLLVAFFSLSIQRAIAIPPPDFIFNAGAQLTQFFSFILIFLGTGYITFIQFLKIFYKRLKINKIHLIVGILFIIIASLLFTYIYKLYYQQNVIKP